MSKQPPSYLATDYFLAIDQGGQSTRVAIYSGAGEQICCYSSACATTHQKIEGATYEYVEQDGGAILAGVRGCLQSIQQYLGDEVTRIKAASFAGQGSSLLCWDKYTGAALTPVISWQDIRGEAYLRGVPLSHAQARQLTGLRLSPHYGATKMRWCLEHHEAVKRAQRENRLCTGPIVSYLFWHLLDKTHKVDPGHAQRTLLWNLAHNQWDQTLLDLFNIPRKLLPECQYHNSHFGDLVMGNHRVPFTASARDQGASLFARGQPELDTCYINIGTGAFVQRLSKDLQAADGLLVSPLWLPENPAQPGYYAWEATVNGAAAAISYIQLQAGVSITPQVMDLALALNPTGDCYFLNAVGGLSAPYWRTDVSSRFSDGLSAEEKILAWIESVIFQIVINVRLMNQSGDITTVILSGGFSQSDPVCQKIADLTRLQVRRSDNPDATVQGAACMAAGLPPFWQPALTDVVFTPQCNPSLSQRFAVWQQAMDEWLR